MITCDNCGAKTREIVPWLRPTPYVVDGWNPTTANQVLPRAALEALGHEIPWGQHPEDDRYGQLCVPCADELRDPAPATKEEG